MNDRELEDFRLQWKQDLNRNLKLPDTNKSLSGSQLERLEPKESASSRDDLLDSARSVQSASNIRLQHTTSPEASLAGANNNIDDNDNDNGNDNDNKYNSDEKQQASAVAQIVPTLKNKVLFSNAVGSEHRLHEPVLLTALEAYEKGVEKERQGMLSDALVFYRRAFKIDPGVDKLFRDAYKAGKVKEATYDHVGSSMEETNYAKFVQVGHDYNPEDAYESTSELKEMTKMMAALRMPVEIEVPEGADSAHKGISSLPEEILHQILTYALVADAASCFTPLSMTCQKFFILLHDQSMWKELCYNTYQDQIYTGEGVPLGSESAYVDYVNKLNEESLGSYKLNWKRMFIEKPRIRYNGIYISTCHYTRPGVREESLDWTSPIHLVTYFRFLRFFPNGECLSLLTPTEPREVVHNIMPGTKLKGVQKGRWSMTRAGQVSIEANGPSNYLFFMELQIRSSSRGRQNKLAWTKFFGVHPLSAEVTHFKNDRSHYFHRVRSYTDKVKSSLVP
ncbi:protein of unknown function [Taphrina deformans PYCC 5710]|uniref:F-box domain-containing protein n=1 Tax=Taphrina deformans (strain PYCC 5710 / ATCC 11124 / CBS 356.35 / IMI 108563 / JCM 9778 / NBRC 8474) TaxID=1097556 RepID=R4XMH0_TAPDE|nr:protein of unknown function [Taphrina deformans PYCC 5710]|eukprot:CCG84505.1 protein of unknown function [Taphrina deformans PYCC 5710]